MYQRLNGVTIAFVILVGAIALVLTLLQDQVNNQRRRISALEVRLKQAERKSEVLVQWHEARRLAGKVWIVLVPPKNDIVLLESEELWSERLAWVPDILDKARIRKFKGGERLRLHTSASRAHLDPATRLPGPGEMLALSGVLAPVKK